MKRTALLALALLPAVGISNVQQGGEDIEVKSKKRTNVDSTITSRQTTVNGIAVQEGVEFCAEGWGWTWQQVEAKERELRNSVSTLADHTGRLNTRKYGGDLSKRYADGEIIKGLPRDFVLRMVHAMSGGHNEWSVGTVSFKEILIGRRIGRYVWLTFMPNGKVKRRVVEAWDINSTFRCDNPTEGFVWTERVTYESPVVLREHSSSTVDRPIYCEEGVTPQQRQAQAQVINVTNVNISNGGGHGILMGPSTVYTLAPQAPFYFFRDVKGGASWLWCPPGERPDLPPPPPGGGGGGGTIGTPPNNDENYPRRPDGSRDYGKKVGTVAYRGQTIQLVAYASRTQLSA
ncbi:MAG TPA: hypothetical protein VLA04_02365 [Verrucomicrobiae bacterium]|nr:hypothetical protein [Verrucomicrobiae bacterium]